MKFSEFQDEARLLIGGALEALGLPEVDLDLAVPPNPSYGDLSSSCPLRLAKSLGLKPGDVALKVADKIMSNSGKYRYVGSVSAHPGGYLNFSLNFAKFAVDAIEEARREGPLGASTAGEGKSLAIEHTNVNPNKALHIGHARNLVLGDSLVRVMRHLGHPVQSLNYIDDSGAQVADIIVGFKFLEISDKAPPGTKFDSYCGDNVYVRVNQEYSKNPTLREKQSAVLREIERGEGETAKYTRSIVAKIVADQLSTCWRLGAAYDLLNWESQIVHSGMWERIFESMKSKGMVKLETEGENEGCWVITDPETGEQKVVVRSDGTVVYVAKDIPYAAWKIGLVEDPFLYRPYEDSQPGGGGLYTTSLTGDGERTKFGACDVAISVIDARQAYLQKIVGKVLEGISPGSGKRYLHRGYEVVALSKRTASELGFSIDGGFAHMSGRKGLYVNVDTMLGALKKKAREETRKRNLRESEGWVEDVAEAIAVAALRYELVKQDPDKMIVFDMEESLRFEGDTGPYLLYTYARARRILDKTEGRPQVDAASAPKLVRPVEKKLLKQLSMLDSAVATAGEYLSPKEVAKYAHELALSFNEFYEKVPVNQESDGQLRDARLALVDAVSRVLAQSATLIGLPLRKRI
ncbi:MAG: arginine--tRNA ligase [Nitrososphaerales archaeon]|nr:arginine--tRNA ligase [Nitrososphaerales archaeon]